MVAALPVEARRRREEEGRGDGRGVLRARAKKACWDDYFSCRTVYRYVLARSLKQRLS